MKKTAPILIPLKKNMSDDAAAVAVNYLSDYLSRYYGKR